MAGLYNILTNCPLFSGLSADQIERSLESPDNFAVLEFKNGERVAQKDTTYSGLMIILKGRVYGQITDKNGREHCIDHTEAPQLILPAFLFGGYNRLPLDVMADGDVQIMILHRGFLFELMQNNVVIMSNFIDIISNRANLWTKKIFFLSFRSLKEKVISYLLDHTSQSDPSMPLSEMAELSQLLDATRIAIETVFRELERKQFVRLENNRVTVLKRKELADLIAD